MMFRHDQIKWMIFSGERFGISSWWSNFAVTFPQVSAKQLQNKNTQVPHTRLFLKVGLGLYCSNNDLSQVMLAPVTQFYLCECVCVSLSSTLSMDVPKTIAQTHSFPKDPCWTHLQPPPDPPLDPPSLQNPGPTPEPTYGPTLSPESWTHPWTCPHPRTLDPPLGPALTPEPWTHPWTHNWTCPWTHPGPTFTPEPCTHPQFQVERVFHSSHRASLFEPFDALSLFTEAAAPKVLKASRLLSPPSCVSLKLSSSQQDSFYRPVFPMYGEERLSILAFVHMAWIDKHIVSGTGVL